MGNLVQWYPKFFNSLANKEVDVNSDTFKLVALASSYTFDATDQYYADLSGELSTGSGYTSGGWTLSGVNFDLNYFAAVPAVGTTPAVPAFWRWRMLCSALSMAGSTAMCRHLAVVDTTPASNKPLVCLFTLRDDTNVAVDKMPQTFGPNASIGGIAYIDLSVAA